MKAVRYAAVGTIFLVPTPCLRAGVPGIMEENFDPDVTGGSVYAAVVQPDGKILLGGSFTAVGSWPRMNLARLNADGSVESTVTFDTGAGVNGRLNSIALQADGKILIAGDFTAVNNQPRNRIARLQANGSLESTATFNPGSGADAFVRSVAVQPDGKILIGGDFGAVNGLARGHIARLLANGTVESLAGFNPGAGPDDGIHSFTVRPEGKILVWGRFDHWNNQVHNRIVQLNPDGTMDSTTNFNPGAAADNWVWSVAVQRDGKLVVGGEFLTMNGQPRARIARLNSNGSVESLATFNPGTGADSTIRCIVVQADGMILISGLFTSVNDQPRNRIARLNPDGTLESTNTFHIGSGANEAVSTLAVQNDGRIVAGGAFTAVDGVPRNLMARLWNEPASEALSAVTNSRVRWERGGTSPEVEEVTFDHSTDGGSTWMPLGKAVRVAGGWERTGFSLPSSGHLRARGRTVCGLTNGSCGRIESVTPFSFLSPLQRWRQTHFGITENTGSAASNADPDMDLVENLFEFTLGLDPNAPNDGALPQWQRLDDDYVLSFTRAVFAEGITCTAEYNTALSATGWTPIPNTAVDPDYRFYAPFGVGPRLFLRLRVSGE